MKSASAQTGNFPAGLSWWIAHLDPPRCPGHLLWVRGGAGSCLTSLMRYTLCPPVSVCDPRGSTDWGKDRCSPGTAQETEAPRHTASGLRARWARTGHRNPQPSLLPHGPGLWRIGSGSGSHAPRWTPVWSPQGSAATRSAPSCTSTPSPRSRTARGTTVASASTVGVGERGSWPGARPASLCPRPSCSYKHRVRRLGAGEALSHPRVPPQDRRPWTTSSPRFLTRRLVFEKLCVLPIGPAEHESEPASEALFLCSDPGVAVWAGLES